MCRIFAASGKFLNTVTRKWLREEFRNLEKSMGGHGNGLFIRYTNDSTYLLKGEHVTVEEVLSALYHHKPELEIKHMIFHTRLVSAGKHCDEQCHPFVGQDFVVAHNGHVHQYAGNKRGFSDTQCVAHLLEERILTIDALTDFSSYWIVEQADHEIAVVSSRRGFKVMCYPGFPEYWSTANEFYTSIPDTELWDLPTGIWYPGDALPKSVFKAYFNVTPGSYVVQGYKQTGILPATTSTYLTAPKADYGYEADGTFFKYEHGDNHNHASITHYGKGFTIVRNMKELRKEKPDSNVFRMLRGEDVSKKPETATSTIVINVDDLNGGFDEEATNGTALGTWQQYLEQKYPGLVDNDAEVKIVNSSGQVIRRCSAEELYTLD